MVHSDPRRSLRQDGLARIPPFMVPKTIPKTISCQRALALPQSVISLPKTHDTSSRGASGTESGPADAGFKTTHWSSVLHAADSKDPMAEASLSRLCQTYWYPLYYYIRRLGHSPHDAQDLTQGFLARLVHKDYLNGIKQEKAKFRSFLLVTLKHFLANEWDRANRLKRGGGKELVSFDAHDTENRFVAEPVDEMSPEKAFERRWALALLSQVLSRLEREFCVSNKAPLFEELKGLLSGEEKGSSYAEPNVKPPP